MGPKNALVCVFLRFWLSRDQCRETQSKTQTLDYTLKCAIQKRAIQKHTKLVHLCGSRPKKKNHLSTMIDYIIRPPSHHCN